MRPRRSTRNAGGSRGGCDYGVNKNGDSSPCPPGGEMDESIVLDAKNLLEMLGASSPVPGEEGGSDQEEEGDEEEDEKLDLVMDLDSRFKSADLKRKFSESVLQISGGGVLSDETGGFAVAGSSGDSSGSATSGEGRSSSSISISGNGSGNGSGSGGGGGSGSDGGGVVVSLPEAGVPAAPPAPRHIKTVLRVRPLEPSAGRLSLRVVDSKTVMTVAPIAKNGASAQIFKYGKVLDETVPQESVFDETAKPLVEGLLQGPGKNGLVMAYGATNAGKTHTIMGARGEDDGILPRTLAAVYEGIAQGASSGNPDEPPGGGGGGEAGRGDPPMRVNFRVVEVYTNKAYDLLRDEQERGPPLTFRQSQGEDKMEGLSNHYPEDLAAALELVKRARSRAPISSTALNATSSRGHTVWMVGVQRGDGLGEFSAVDGRAGGVAGKGGGGLGAAQQPPVPRNPMLWVVDLAGSERIGRSLSKDNTAAYINSDITDLFRCFKQVEAGHPHVTFRARTLTRMLKNVLVRGADSADPRMSCVMVVNVNPAASEYGETKMVLNNALISMRARIVAEPPRAGRGSEIAEYGLNGHLLMCKRPRITGGGIAIAEQGGAADGVPLRPGSVSGQDSDMQLALAERSVGPRRVWSAQRTTMSRSESALVVELQESVARLEAENADLQQGMVEKHAELWAEFDPQLQRAEKDLDKSLLENSGLRVEIDRLKDLLNPVAANARAAVAQSARKQAAKHAQTFSTQLSQNVREAEDETLREAEKRVVAEEALATALEALATALAGKEAEAARAAEELAVRAASEAAVGQELARSEGRVVRLEADVARVEARADELEVGKAGLVDQLKAAVEEIGRLQEAVAIAEAEVNTVQMNASTSSRCLDDLEPHRFALGRPSDPITFDSPLQRSTGSAGKRKGGRSSSSSSSVAAGGDEGGSGHSSAGGGSSGYGEEPVRRTRASSRACPTRSSARGASFGRGAGGDRVGARASISSSLSVQDGGGCNEGGGCGGGGDGGNDDKEDGASSEGSRNGESETTVSSPEVAVAGGGGDGGRDNGTPGGEDEVDDKEEEESKAGKRKVSAMLKEEGKVRSGGDPKVAENESGEEGEAERGGGRPKKRGIRSTRLRLPVRKPLAKIQQADGNAGGVAAAASAAADGKKKTRAGDCGEEEEEKAAGRKIKQEKEEEKSRRAAKSRQETRRCKAAREKAMLSKPSPEVVTLTEKQAEIVDRANKLIKARRSGRRRGQR